MKKIQTGTGRLRRTEAFAQVPDGSGNVNSVVSMYLTKLAEYTEIATLYNQIKVNSITIHWNPKDPNVTGLYAISCLKTARTIAAHGTWVEHVEQGDRPIKWGNLNKPFTFRYKNPEKEWHDLFEADADGDKEDYNVFLNIRDAPVSTNVGQLLITIDVSLR